MKYGPPRYDEKQARDTVLGQDPAPGARIVSGGEVTLTLSLGRERYTIPDVVGYKIEDVIDDLEAAKLVVERVLEYSDLYELNLVIKTDPPAGGEVGPNTKITVTISKGPAPIKVPNVVGKNIDQARRDLEKLKLKVKTEEREDDKPAGTVVAQSPDEGAGLEEGNEVTLTVSKGPPVVGVPEVRGRPGPEATQVLEQAGFKVRGFGCERGRVIIQDPGGGAQLKKGEEVRILCGG
jgi:serine/threonine-protein kinase